jgi:hypothetical protein
MWLGQSPPEEQDGQATYALSNGSVIPPSIALECAHPTGCWKMFACHSSHTLL